MPDVTDFDGYLFDLDGTVLLGDQLLPGVLEALGALRKAGKTILFLTNTTTRTRRECQLRLQRLGLEAHLDEMLTAAYVSALYLREREGEPRKVFVVGEPALAAELEEQGIPHAADAMEATHVLVGMDMHFHYDKLHQAMKAVRNGAALIAANPDPFCPVDGDVLPDTWSMVKAIEAASCVTPHAVIGKPSKYYGDKVLQSSGLAAERCLMIGDRLETDILFGANNGLRTALVLTGVTSEDDLRRSPIQPDYVWSTLHEISSAFAASESPAS
ncbi:HAD-IIA family hydrolase [Paenibacillus rigui]|uniref:Acid sugar phosphatase n=1 Tax=Paenibacillus rigui TaxID=554312 RepID=A0A229UR75_9BACL|nr:HAD-IIA family hydrolase [Paenibacillus rigui]OXM85685.1 haloacid dehalogenase [Paenibacillus rigui]